MLHAQQCAEHVGLEHRRKASGRLFCHRARLAFRAGIVHGHIQAPEASDRSVDEALHLVLMADIGVDELGFSAYVAQFGDQSGPDLVVAARDDQPRALLGEG